MKRKMFIGSSAEGYPIALKVKEIIEQACGDWMECETWKDGIFKPNHGTLASLITAANRFDYGILIASYDDLRLSREEVLGVPRDNVVFELGLFVGSLGLSRAYILADKSLQLPSDYNGITVPKYTDEGTLENDLKGIINQLRLTQNTFNLKAIPSAALALGYYDNFIYPFVRKMHSEEYTLNILLPSKLNDIKASIEDYKHRNPSQEISVFEDGSRPRINALLSDPTIYWDIPTTLSTLYKLIGKIVPSTEVGNDPNIQAWVEYELRNFKGTIASLIEKESFRDKIKISICDI